MDLNSKTIVVIGGTSGLGLAGAKALSRHGARIIIVGRNQSKIDAALGEIQGDALGVQGDAADSQTPNKAVELAIRQFGGLQGLYHVAGGSGRSFGDGALHEVSDEGLDKTLDLNLKSVIYSNRAAVRQFLKQGAGGVILNMGSVLAFSPSPDYFSTHVYAAAKSAIIGFSKSIAASYSKDGIRVNVIAPALVATPMSQRATENNAIVEFIRLKQPLALGFGLPQDLDDAVVFFLSDASKAVTGQILAADHGWSVSEGRQR